MQAPASLQGRLALILGIGITLLWGVAALSTAQVLQHEIEEVFDSALEETAQRILPLAVIDIIGRSATDTVQRVAPLRPHEEYFTYLVRDEQGRVLIRSHGANADDFPPYNGMGFDRTDTHRLYSDAAVQGTITITVAEPLSHRKEALHESLTAMVWPILLLLPLSIVGVFTVVRYSLRPLRDLRDALATRGAGDLSPVEGGGLPDEIRPVASTINQLMDKLKRALEAEQSFAADAAHELRTPVAAALAQVQRLRAHNSDPRTEAHAADVESALKRLKRLSEKLLQLSRVEAGRMRGETATDVRSVIEMVTSDFRAPEKGTRLTLDLPGTPILSDIDNDALAITLRNLLDNAIRHGSGGQPIEVWLGEDGALHVRNDCAPIDASQLQELPTRFQRGQTMSDGSGVGLSIVSSIADRVGTRFEVRSPADGRARGFEAVFQIPLRQDA
ncbi:ATP-binding protein [Sediminimonas qiaohouensis]|uniref:ATP-binding protein n=1 Tax=Sediminimonas qiaohouensis TaxID=552061 RepID=UPI000412BE8C|nr:ATP-binding protein [Sediminimonas qiaohouensis]